MPLTTEVQFFFCNKTYNERWLEDMQTSNAHQYAVIMAIVRAIEASAGGDISQAQVLELTPEVGEYIRTSEYKILPNNGQGLEHNGDGIRHVKYSPSKSVAVLWEKVGTTIFVTFDDHAPVAYHRAIHSFCQLRLGKNVLPKHPRTSRKMIELLKTKDTRPHVNFEHVRYSNDVLSGNPGLIGKKLRIYFDPRDIRVIHAFFEDGSELGVRYSFLPLKLIGHPGTVATAALQSRRQICYVTTASMRDL